MKVGIIGLGRMGEGMSRRMMKAGIEVWGYRRNYQKAEEAFEKGYVSGVTTDIPNLVNVKKKIVEKFTPVLVKFLAFFNLLFPQN